MRLEERKYRILMAIIDDYIATAMPVGSRTISKKQDIGGLSSATIRNEMSDLEELGYLEQPHTSAGRIPSAKAYRMYVDSLLKGASPRLKAEEARKLRLHFDSRARQVEAVIESAARAISDVTNYTALITLPTAAKPRLRRVELVPVGENTALLVLVLDIGVVKDAIIHMKEAMSADHLHEVSNMLTDQLSGLSPEEAREKLPRIGEIFHLHREMLGGVLEAIEQGNQREVKVGGRSNILQYPEYSDAEKAREIIHVLETRDKLFSLLQGTQQMSFTIRIGDETGMPETSGCSVVSMSYRVGDEKTGTIGVIGPTRMRYASVIPVLHHMSQALNDLLREQGK